MKKLHKSLLTHQFCAQGALALAMMFAATAPAFGQDMAAAQAADNGPAAARSAVDNGDIVVTAQRREQKLQDVGIAITAFSGETLKNMGVNSSIDIARVTPGVAISASGGGQNSQFSIRGVTQNDFNDALEAPVAVYVDETYVPNLNGQIFGTFDLQRVEVLKGPQGTLFGRNATGGLVSFVPNKPSDTANGYLDVGYGRFNHLRIEGAVGLPIGEDVSIRLSGLYNRHDPIFNNIYPYGVDQIAVGKLPPQSECCGDVWDDDTLALRGQIQLQPTDRLTIRATGSFSRTNTTVNPYNNVATIGVFDAQGRLINSLHVDPTETRIGIGPGGINVDNTGQPTTQTRPTPGGDVYGYFAPSAESLDVSLDWAKEDMNRFKSYDAALHLNYDLDSAEIVSITDYRRFDKLYGTDVDAGPTNSINYRAAAITDSFSQEVRITGTGKGPFRWVAGAYYLNTDTKIVNGFKALPGSVFAALFPGLENSGIDLINNQRLKTWSASVFGQIEYDFAPRLTFILGGRYIYEHQNFSIDSFGLEQLSDYGLSSGVVYFPGVPAFADKRGTKMWAGKAQLEFRPQEGMLFYIGVNRGVKSGNYNTLLFDGSPPLAQNLIPYKPEQLISYEGGAKVALFDGLATLDVSAFYYDYNNYQTFFFQNVSGIVSNKDAEQYGIEASINIRPARGLNIGLGASLLHARIKDVAIATGVVRTVEPTFTPSKMIAGQINYNIPGNVGGGNFSVNVDGSWRGRVFGNIRNHDSDIIRSYFLANAHVYWTTEDDHWKLGFGVENVFDKRFRTVTYNLTTLCGCNEESYGKPRWWNVSARYSF